MITNFTAELTVKELEDLIRKAVELETRRTVISMKFRTKTSYSGYGPNEVSEQIFDGVDVKLGELVRDPFDPMYR